MTTLAAHPPVRIPKSLDRRPKFKGWPIPFTSLVDGEGKPDFRVNDLGKVARIRRLRLCALCGEALPPNWSAFIGGPLCAQSGAFIDGPMHESCARYALTICPYLFRGKGHALLEAIAKRHKDNSVVLSTYESASSDRPDSIGLFLVRFWQSQSDGEHIYFLTPVFDRQEWYA